MRPAQHRTRAAALALGPLPSPLALDPVLGLPPASPRPPPDPSSAPSSTPALCLRLRPATQTEACPGTRRRRSRTSVLPDDWQPQQAASSSASGRWRWRSPRHRSKGPRLRIIAATRHRADAPDLTQPDQARRPGSNRAGSGPAQGPGAESASSPPPGEKTRGREGWKPRGRESGRVGCPVSLSRLGTEMP
jgi:hypothetical protein